MATEFARIAEISRRLAYSSAEVTLGIGDDAAVLVPNGRAQVYSVDSQVEGVHFRHDLLAPSDIGFRAMTAALSDLAAMGARPRAALMALIVPKAMSDAALYALVDGAAAAQREYACPIVGGNLARGSQLSVTTTVIGEALSSPLTRAGASAGDELYVTGELGGAALGLSLLDGKTDLDAPRSIERWRRPAARIQDGLALVALASAAIDLSDGLLQDLRHLAQASGVAVEIELPLVPVHAELLRHGHALGLDPALFALGAGEDYELAFALPANRATGVGKRIGRVVQGSGVHILDASGQNLSIQIPGFDHFE